MRLAIVFGWVLPSLLFLGCGGNQPPARVAPAASAPPRERIAERPVAPPDPTELPTAVAEVADAPADSGPLDPTAEVTLPPDVVAHMLELVARHPERRMTAFAKIGDSATVNRAYLQCLSRDQAMTLEGFDELRALIEEIRETRVGGTDAFSRQSEAAGVGWSVHRVLRGTPSPVAREIRELNPRFAFVMFGSNDVELGRISRYANRLTQLVDQLLSWGVMPVLSTIPPRADDRGANEEVPRYNAVIQAVGRSHRIPVLDLHSAMMSLPRRGLASDGVHPNAPIYHGRARGCDFSEVGLTHGQNVRNLMTLRMLSALRAAAEADPAAVIDAPRRTAGRTVDSPTFAAQASTVGGTTERAEYPGCEEAVPEHGPERHYSLHLSARAAVRGEVMYTDDVDVDLHVLSEGRCVSRGDRRIEVTLDPGDYEVVVDTFGDSPAESAANAGRFTLLLEQAEAEEARSLVQR